ncbi:hypothetical protein B0H10DRAFT_980245 [Mycena sp. CBHHK59/15]|nr:hypothetical protein B0H10DRAFT_980245 [Mycena sp. CBHHK59/15]
MERMPGSTCSGVSLVGLGSRARAEMQDQANGWSKARGANGGEAVSALHPHAEPRMAQSPMPGGTRIRGPHLAAIGARTPEEWPSRRTDVSHAARRRVRVHGSQRFGTRERQSRTCLSAHKRRSAGPSAPYLLLLPCWLLRLPALALTLPPVTPYRSPRSAYFLLRCSLPPVGLHHASVPSCLVTPSAVLDSHSLPREYPSAPRSSLDTPSGLISYPLFSILPLPLSFRYRRTKTACCWSTGCSLPSQSSSSSYAGLWQGR